MIELSEKSWFAIGDSAKYERIVNRKFDGDFKFRRWQHAPRSEQVPVFVDKKFGLEWTLAPAGEFSMGMSSEEKAAARSLNSAPFLNFEEMEPSISVNISAFLVSVLPLSISVSADTAVDTIGPSDTLLFTQEVASGLAEKFDSQLPSEQQWEYACRAGSKDLFWFGSTLPDHQRMARILGLSTPTEINAFGLSSLFFGEWCTDLWRENLDPNTAADEGAGGVIRGGAARFWPWQDEREWAGCVSAFRMPGRDSGGAGAAVRLVRGMRT